MPGHIFGYQPEKSSVYSNIVNDGYVLQYTAVSGSPSRLVVTLFHQYGRPALCGRRRQVSRSLKPGMSVPKAYGIPNHPRGLAVCIAIHTSAWCTSTAA